MTGFQVPECSCGHAVGDHQGARNRWPHPPLYGACLRHGCDCKQFTPVNPSSRKEPPHVQVQGDGDGDHPVRPAVAAGDRGGGPVPVVLELVDTRVRALSTGLVLGGVLGALTVPLAAEVLRVL